MVCRVNTHLYKQHQTHYYNNLSDAMDFSVAPGYGLSSELSSELESDVLCRTPATNERKGGSRQSMQPSCALDTRLAVIFPPPRVSSHQGGSNKIKIDVGLIPGHNPAPGASAAVKEKHIGKPVMPNVKHGKFSDLASILPAPRTTASRTIPKQQQQADNTGADSQQTTQELRLCWSRIL
ncbi:hypothetical protein DL89DRAFT_166689 [Linderina pennispora]|uniref:Uncharacterized protein n=1 Tax=Linderina pennispora TaxID=61395 RepID=A0A1Y1VTR5_9FUNG|nr:uncharacterized protein DL89DRAFT_166689 [Linderina pennispora]ORX64678.1 hypothetical protein DL89DRAFT_166689 [Linderina pennispora]